MKDSVREILCLCGHKKKDHFMADFAHVVGGLMECCRCAPPDMPPQYQKQGVLEITGFAVAHSYQPDNLSYIEKRAKERKLV